MLTMYSYPLCGTCRKAKKWLDEHAVSYQEINIAKKPPDREQLKAIIEKSGLPVGKFFNTSGKSYRAGGFSQRKKAEPEDKWLDWLAEDGMLIKRPLVFDKNKATVGFNEQLFENEWGKV
ncbi:Spx/MgsR family RNA polymerase-binding regulatory protein [Sporolactobacillus sp. CPB3-1]|uniref:Spx/MgsR family RNA polymerase-binding regulatory protein n=1 Tax=Sporolactobacillus mangiferae TaxID=2940498 RepID=A0ABT0M8E2_9BACL|nr:Spx/MgsR family RNA polymerase-binding regulatory protein [Sporolactobacillus mangiferae]MCL1631126.1 Spx/MgsR family RNA polymerase-binding regulatory protein [Sporolactobacillus mangiferae]